MTEREESGEEWLSRAWDEWYEQQLANAKKSLCDRSFPWEKPAKGNDYLNFEWFETTIEHLRSVHLTGQPRDLQYADERTGLLSRRLRDHQSGLSRGDLFELARTAFTDDPSRSTAVSDQGLFDFAWHVLIWGSGRSMRCNRRRIDSILDWGPMRIRSAVDMARSGDVAEAYRSMLRGGPNHLTGLGPAFFTKILHFAGGGDEGWKPLILDSRVATAIRVLGANSEAPKDLWTPRGYARYCEALAERAASEKIRADQLEQVLFDIGKDLR